MLTINEKHFSGKNFSGAHADGDPLSLLWQPDESGDGIRLLRVFGDSPVVVLPDTIEGKKITEIGDYCFAPSCPKFRGEVFRTELFKKEKEYTELCGPFVQEVRLPSFVKTLRNAAFYNCRKLKKLSVGTMISGIGSDEFTNDTRLEELIIRGSDTAATGLSLILERIAENITAFFCPKETSDPETAPDSVLPGNLSGDAAAAHASPAGVLFFPEYYEWLDEISPAHIFSRSINGEGFRMRKSFQNGILDYDKYDACFENALVSESPDALCRIALCRLRYPAHLKNSYREKYEAAVRKFLPTALRQAVKAQDFSLLTWVCRNFSPDGEELSAAIGECIASGWGEGNSFLIEEKHHRFTKKTFDFDLDF